MDLGGFSSGALTGLREGVEAALIVSIICAYLARTGHRDQFGRVFVGAGLAAALSAVLGVGLYVTVGSFQEPYEQLFEATTLMVAAGVVTWMLFWMRRQAASVKGELQAAVDRALREGTVTAMAVLAFVAVLREGIETALFLVGQAASADQGAPSVVVGAVAGLAGVLSAVLGLGLFATVGSFQEPYEQLFEATTLLVAAGVVTWMLFWMRRQSAALKGDLHAAIDRALGDGTAWGLAALAFASVIREGVETALFLAAQATSVSASASSVALGAVGGLAAASLIGWGFYRGSRAVDLRKFFRWTGIALVFIAAGLFSKAIHEYLEVAGIAHIAVIGSQPAYDISRTLSEETGIGQFLRAILGYSAAPEVLTLAGHLAYVVVVLWLYLRPSRPLDRTARPTVAGA